VHVPVRGCAQRTAATAGSAQLQLAGLAAAGRGAGH
jgi:hypothetical protein